MNESLISPNQTWLLLAVMFGAAWIGLWAEKTKWGRKLSGVVITIIIGFLCSNLRIIPTEAGLYDLVWSYLVPLAIPLLLFKADLRRIFREAGPTLIAFFIGGIGTILGTYIAFATIQLGAEGWKMAGIFCATYIGGSMNYMAAASSLNLQSGDYLAAGMAADNLVMTVYLLILFALPAVNWVVQFFVSRDQPTVDNTNAAAENQTPMDLMSTTKALAIAAGVCAIGFLLGDLTGLKGSGILWMTAIIVILATVFPKKIGTIAGADVLGTWMMQVFFAVIGASASIWKVYKVGPSLFIFAAIILLVHLAFLLIMGKLFRLDIKELVIASNANMGGPTTAAAMAVAKKWDELVIPAILCGTLGYAIATFLGVGVAHWLGG